MAFELHLLGVPRLALDGRAVAVSWPRRSLALLVYLVTARGFSTRDAVAFALWPDESEEEARGNLRRNLNVLRAALPPEVAAWIVVDSSSIGFDHETARTDVATFEALAAKSLTYERAVQMYGGDFAAPLYDAWALAERDRLRSRFHAVLAELMSTSFSARRFAAALDYARRIAADEPFREDVLRQILAIRYAMGDRPGALAEFERFRRALDREMAIEPMAETRWLHELVLRGDPLPFAPDAGRITLRGPDAMPSTLLPFGGRDVPLERLQQAWESAGTARGGVVFISGEAGIGKTRLVAELLAQTVGTGARILRGTTASPEARPFEPILAALAGASPYLSSIDIEPVWLAVLAPLIAEIGARVNAQAPAVLPPEREALRIFEAFARLLIAVARGRPVVVVLEDLHWAGPATLTAIGRIASRIRGHRILLLVTYRKGEGRAVEALRRELSAAGYADAVALERLADAQALDVLAQLAQPPSPARAQELVTRSEGNPLFLTELLREYPLGGENVATGIADIVRARVEHASADAQLLARVAATCGSTFDLDLLGAVVGWSDGALIDGIAELLERQFIRATATHERGSYAFTHALVRGAVAELASAAERQRIHRIVARSLEARAAGRLHAAEIARHWQAADEPERAAQAYVAAVEASIDAHARDEAVALATSGEALATDPRLRYTLVRLRLMANLRRAPMETLRADIASLARLAEAIDEPARYDVALLACQVEQIGGSLKTRRQCAAALQSFALGATPLRSAQTAEIETVDELEFGSPATAIVTIERARACYQELGAEIEESRAAIRLARMHAGFGNHSQAAALLGTLEARVTTGANLSLTMDYWLARAVVAHARYDAEAMLHAANACREAARAVGDRLMEGHAAIVAGSAHGTAVRLTHAFRETALGAEIYLSLGSDRALRLAANNRASYLLQVGRIAEAVELLRDNLQQAQADGSLEQEYFSVSNLGVAQLAAGHAGQAGESQRRAVALARQIGSPAFEALALGDLGAAQAAAGDVAGGVAHLVTAAGLHAASERAATRAHDLARAARWEPEPQRAATFAREALAIFAAASDAYSVKHAPEILWCCATAFERGAEPAAADYARRTGRAILERHLLAIEDPADRDFYRAIAPHAALLGASPEAALAVDAAVAR